MASPTVGTTHRDPDDTPHAGGRLVSERSPTYGVSDQRRAELERLEADAGTVQDDAQESQRPTPGQPDNNARHLRPDPDSADGQVNASKPGSATEQ